MVFSQNLPASKGLPEIDDCFVKKFTRETIMRCTFCLALIQFLGKPHTTIDHR